LLNIEAKFRGNGVQGMAQTRARIEVHARDDRNHENCAEREPAAQP
jgi:hypothetical protein